MYLGFLYWLLLRAWFIISYDKHSLFGWVQIIPNVYIGHSLVENSNWLTTLRKFSYSCLSLWLFLPHASGSVECRINSLDPGRLEWNFRQIIFKISLVMHGWSISYVWSCPEMDVTGHWFRWCLAAIALQMPLKVISMSHLKHTHLKSKPHLRRDN